MSSIPFNKMSLFLKIKVIQLQHETFCLLDYVIHVVDKSPALNEWGLNKQNKRNLLQNLLYYVIQSAYLRIKNFKSQTCTLTLKTLSLNYNTTIISLFALI